MLGKRFERYNFHKQYRTIDKHLLIRTNILKVYLILYRQAYKPILTKLVVHH